ncbi:MAG: 50S ribosomal protein L10 [Actinomycetota bacterium]|nr:50S ribosomal protein L10 [Actinomycetota bacterium]
MARQEKISEVEKLKEIFKGDHDIIFTDHSGLKADDAVAVRDKLVEANSYLRIIKNTLASIAARDVFKELDLDGVFKGPTSMVVSGEDMISTAKVLEQILKDLDTLKIKAGLFEKQLLSEEEVNKFASLPDREVLLTNLVVSIKSPLTKLVNILGMLTRDLVVVLDAIRAKKEKIDN